jgi:hypothetical protein
MDFGVNRLHVSTSRIGSMKGTRRPTCSYNGEGSIGGADA